MLVWLASGLRDDKDRVIVSELYVEFPGPAAVHEQEGHLQHAGLFLPAVDPLPEVNSEVTLQLRGLGRSAKVVGRVVQVFAGTGFAVAPADPAAAREALQPLFDAAREADEGEAGPAVVSWTTEDADTDEDAGGTLHDRIRKMSVRERLHLARHGGRAERLILAKDVNKTVHTFLVQNKGITLDEVRAIAGNRQFGPDALKMISENRAWMQNPGIVSALVRNPKTPATISVRLLDKLPTAEVQRLAKSNNVPRPVMEASRRKVLKGRG